MSSRKLRYLPLSYDVAGKHVAVVGNGTAARGKIELLARTQARITLFAPAPRLDLSAIAAASGVEHVPAYPAAADLAGVALLYVATDDATMAGRLSALAGDLGIAVNVVDRPHLSTFAVPAIVDRGPLTVAIASDGTAPVLAQRVRALVDALLPQTLANLGELARSVRAAVLDRLPGNAERRRFWWRTFDGDAGAAALSGNLDRARSLALADLDAAHPLAGTVHLVGVPAGAEDLLTLRAQRLLLLADVVVQDAEVSSAVTAMSRRDATRVSVGPGGRETAALLARLAREGRQVVRVVAGDPLASSQAAEEIAALGAAGIGCEIVPGVAVPAASASSMAA